MEARPIEPYSNPLLPVPILQGNWEFSELLKIVGSHNPIRSMEIGSFYGGTLWHWINLTWSLVASVDMLVSETDPRRKEQEECRVKWKPWATAKGKTLETFLGDSSSPEAIAFMERYAPYDFFFLDGNHTYGGVKADFENCLRLASKGAMIAMHDILPAPYWTSIEVWKFWNELVEKGYVTQVLCSRNDQYFGQTRDTWGIGVVRLGA
jgi:cephalosporin hydroxylase